jgi:hypothetical protein
MATPVDPRLHTPKTVYQNTTITSGTTTDEIDIKGGTLVAVLIPASVSSTTMTITASPTSGGTFTTIYDGLAQYVSAAGNLSFTIAASKWVIIPASAVVGFNFIKLVFGSSETSKTYTVAYRHLD